MNTQNNQWAATANQREMQLLSMIEELCAQVQELQRQPTRRTRQVLPEPKRFTGRTKDWDIWSMTMRAKLQIDGNTIGNDEAQFYYVYSSLGAKVQELMLNFVRTSQDDKSWKPLTLLEHLGRIYDDPNKAKKADQPLIELRQGTTPIMSYVSQFERFLFEAGASTWPDDAKITTLVGGLNKYTRQRIDGQLTLPTDYNEFNDNTMGWEPIKASAARAAPSVSREQCQVWRGQGKCVRCGSGSHSSKWSYEDDIKTFKYRRKWCTGL